MHKALATQKLGIDHTLYRRRCLLNWYNYGVLTVLSACRTAHFRKWDTSFHHSWDSIRYLYFIDFKLICMLAKPPEKKKE